MSFYAIDIQNESSFSTDLEIESDIDVADIPENVSFTST